MAKFKPRLNKDNPDTFAAQRQSQQQKSGYLQLVRLSAVGCWLGVVFILFQISPNQIKDVLFANSYVPLIVLLAGAVFFTALAILNHWRRSFLLAVVVCLLVLSKLHFSYTNWLAFYLITPIFLLEIALTITREK